MNIEKRILRWGSCVLAATAVATTLIGCVSLHPDDELQQAEQWIAARTGVQVDGFDAPFPPELSRASSRHLVPPTLTVAQARQWAITHHPRIRGRVARVCAARADFAQAHLLPNPLLQAAMGIPSEGGGSPFSASVVQQLAALWNRQTRIDVADARLHNELYGLVDDCQALVADVTLRYVAVVTLREQLSIAQGRTEVLASLFELEKERLRVGEGEQLSLLQSQREWAEAKDAEALLQRDAASARHALQNSVGEDLRSLGSCELAPLPPLPGPVEIAAALRLASLHRFDLQAALARHSGAQQITDLQRWERVPKLSVGVGIQQNFENREGWFPQATMVLPIFDTGRAAVARARANEWASWEQALELSHDIYLEVRDAQLRWQVAHDRLRWIEQQVLIPTRERIALLESWHQVGELSSEQLSRAQLELFRAQSQFVTAKQECYVGWALLERAIGTRLEDAPPSLPPALAEGVSTEGVEFDAKGGAR